MKIRLIIESISVICLLFLFTDAVFFTPLVDWSWGFTNKKLEMFLLIGALFFGLRNCYDIKELKQKIRRPRKNE